VPIGGVARGSVCGASHDYTHAFALHTFAASLRTGAAVPIQSNPSLHVWPLESDTRPCLLSCGLSLFLCLCSLQCMACVTKGLLRCALSRSLR
jgi:hypothetical protein